MSKGGLPSLSGRLTQLQLNDGERDGLWISLSRGAMRRGTSRRRGSPEIGSLMERLQALEDADVFSNAIVTTGPAATAPGRSPGLIRWFTFGFACAFVGGGIVLVALLLVRPAQARPSSRACTNLEPAIQSLLPETRRLWWKLPALSVDRTRAKLARARE